MQFPKIGVGVVVEQDGKLLIGKRINAHGAGRWAFPGGHLEWGETPEACAKRELWEETGLIAESVRKGRWTNDMIDGKHYVNLFMHVSTFSGELENREPHKCEHWEWRSYFDLPAPLFQTIDSFLKAHPVEQEYAYLACPYAHPDEEVKSRRIRAATEAAFSFFQRGIAVFSPLTHNAPLVDMGIGNGWEGKWEGFDLGMLSRANKLYVLTLEGWEHSFGVRAEISFAREHSIPIEYVTLPLVGCDAGSNS